MSGSARQQKVARLILKELSAIFQKNKHGILGDSFVSVADVRMSPDLSVAKVYISLMLDKDKTATLNKLNIHKKEIRKELGMRIRNQVRIIPELIFIKDEVEENAMRLEALIKSLNIPPAPEQQS
jgi:ribosome-binding factor A